MRRVVNPRQQSRTRIFLSLFVNPTPSILKKMTEFRYALVIGTDTAEEVSGSEPKEK